MEGTFKRRKHQESNFELQITALVDTLVIILIFMLKSVATDSLEIDQAKGITLPMVVNGLTGVQGGVIGITAEGVSWNGQTYLQIQNFDLRKPLNGEDGWKALNSAIAATVEQEKTGQTFDGKLLLQADKKTPFPVLQEVLKVAKSHGYKDIRFVGAKYN